MTSREVVLVEGRVCQVWQVMVEQKHAPGDPTRLGWNTRYALRFQGWNSSVDCPLRMTFVEFW